MAEAVADFLLYGLVGLFAQFVDGAMGMGYGVITNVFLLSLGVPPAAASAGVHAAKAPTTALSGASHAWFGNVDWRLLWHLALPGILGGLVGAVALVALAGETVRPFIAVYLLLMGLLILRRAWRADNVAEAAARHLIPLGLGSGFLDAIGGGGWGPIVTSSLVAKGVQPRLAVGSVNLAEFFVTIGTATALNLGIGDVPWSIIAGLVAGGLIAAPFAAYVSRHLPARPVMIAVGGGIILMSLRMIWLSLGR
jgi:uncharacterized membrane protein YfcA